MPTTPELKAEAPVQVTTGRLRELTMLYLRLGTTAFGGPAAHIAMMEGEVVRCRQWLTRGEFLNLLGVINLNTRSGALPQAASVLYGSSR